MAATDASFPLRESPLVFDGVTLLQQDRPLLEDLSFALRAGELACLSGARCAGMAAVLRLACGMGDPAAGEVRICGLPAEFWEPCELARRFRLLTPAAHLFIGCTLIELLANRCGQASAANAMSDDLARFALAHAGIAHLADCVWGCLDRSERQHAQLAFLFARLWSAPPGVRLVIVDDWLDRLPPRLAGKGLAVLRHFAVVREAAVFATAGDAASTACHADRVFVLRHADVARCERHVTRHRMHNTHLH